MKKMLCMLCILAMILSGAAVAEEIINSVVVNIHFVGDSNVRFGPSLNDRGFDVAKKDSYRSFLFDVSVDDRGVAWYLSGDGDATGWVSSKYTELVTESDLVLTAVTEELAPVFFADAAICANPADEAALTTVALEDAAAIEFMGLTYAGETETWYCVRYGACEGWVSDASMELQND